MPDRTTNFILKGKDAASGPIGRVAQAMHNLERQATSLGGRALGGVATAITKVAKVAAVAAVGGLLVLAAGFGTAIVKAAAFEKAMLNVNSIAKATPAEFERMRSSVLAISRDLPQSAETLAAGLYDISSSGFAGAEGITVLEAAAKAASAGLSTTAESAKGITAVLNAYGYGAEKAKYVSDVLFKVVDRGVITFGELAAEIGDVTSIAPLLGVSLEEVGAALAVLTKRGISGAESATALASLMRSILSPTQQAADVAKELGIEWNVAALQAKGLAGFMADLQEAAGDDEEALATLAGDARAIKSLFVLAANGGAQFTTELALMKNAAGATDIALSYQRQGLSYQLDILKNNVSAAAIAIGTKLLPAITPAVIEISEFVAALFASDRPMQVLHGNLEQGQEALDPLTAKLAEWGPLGEILGDVLSTVSAGFRSLGDIWEDIGPTVAGVVNKILGPGGLYESFRKMAGDVFDWVIPKVKALITTFTGPGGVVESVGKVVGPIINDLIPKLGGIVTAIVGGDKGGGLLPALGRLIATLWGDGKGPLALALQGAGLFINFLAVAVTILVTELTRLIDIANDVAKALGPINALLNPFMAGANLAHSVQSQTRRGGFIEGKAVGGPVHRGRPYFVGEHGPEIMVPGQSGTVVPNGALAGAGAGGGAMVFNFNSIWPPSPIQAREIARTVRGELAYMQNPRSRWTRG